MAKETLYDQGIVDAIKTKLAVTAGTDYHVTPVKIFDSQPAPIAEDELPCYNVSDDNDDFLQSESSGIKDDYNLTAYIDIIAASAATVRMMRADAHKIIKANPTWDLSYVHDTKIIQVMGNIIDQSGILIANKRIVIKVQYRRG